MSLILSLALLDSIHAHGEAAYPDEGAGLLFGHIQGDRREVLAIWDIPNAREDGARHNRYLITPKDMLRGEQAAECQGLEVIGIFHSHPDHPNRPSEFDREWALPWYSYIITSIHNGSAVESRSWRLSEDHAQFDAEEIQVESLKVR